MDKLNKKFKSVDDYINSYPQEVQKKLKELRKTIKTAAPNAQEILSYNMPAYKQKRIVTYFAAHKNHIGLYPTSTPIVAFKKELSTYKTAKGSIQFPLDNKLPLSLIAKIVKFKVKENMLKNK